jgi:Ner family transcriptional regulator
MMTKQAPNRRTQLDDWHRADIIAAVRKAGWTLSELARYHGYANRSTLLRPLDRPWPKGERLIAEVIGVEPAEIWPSRYDAEGEPHQRRSRAPKRVLPAKQGPQHSAGDVA